MMFWRPLVLGAACIGCWAHSPLRIVLVVVILVMVVWIAAVAGKKLVKELTR